MPESDRAAVVVAGDLSDGFTAIPNRILFDTSLSPGARCLYALLLSFAWNKATVWPGYDRLMRMLGVASRSTLNKYLDELVTAGVMSRELRAGMTNHYTLHVTVATSTQSVLPQATSTESVLPTSTESVLPSTKSVLPTSTKSVLEVIQEENKGTITPPTPSPPGREESAAIYTVLIKECYGGMEPALKSNRAQVLMVASSLADRHRSAEQVAQVVANMRAAGWSQKYITINSIDKHWQRFTPEGVKEERKHDQSRGRVAPADAIADSWEAE